MQLTTIVPLTQNLLIGSDVGAAELMRRPHFELRERSLYFLISRRPYATLTPEQVHLWKGLVPGTTVAQLQSYYPNCEADLEQFLKWRVCDLLPRTSGQRRRILVIEPHCDDAALSVGGRMWAQQAECEFHIVTLASCSNFTSYYYQNRDFFDLERVSALRAAEGELAARMVGGQYSVRHLPEATQRFRAGSWPLEWHIQQQAALRTSIGRLYEPELLPFWTAEIHELLADTPFDEFWFPMGVGIHADHQLTRDACLSALMMAPDLIEGKLVRLYQEVPYGLHRPEYNERLHRELVASGAGLKPEVIHIEDVFSHKLRILSVFASQFKLEALLQKIDAAARAAAGGTGLAELMWTLTSLPDRLDIGRLAWNRAYAGHEGQEVRSWRRRHSAASLLRLLLVVPSGRWQKDRNTLLKWFPNATIEVHAMAPAASEVRDHPHDRVRLHQLRAGNCSWVQLALRLAPRPTIPTVIVTTEQGMRNSQLFARLLPFSDPLIVASMDTLIRAVAMDDSISA